MKGFDAEFTDLDHYIRVITERIWEGRRIDDIHRYYSPDCAVETPGGVSIGADAVVQSTRDTLAAFPDRELLAEDVLQSGDEDGGFLSSHRIFSPMTHLGPGAFGLPTGRRIHVRTIADCVCRDNRIVHEWLVRDQGAIARQIGSDAASLARTWLAARGPRARPAMPAPPVGYHSLRDDRPLAQSYRLLYEALWGRPGVAALEPACDRAIALAAPGGEALHGHAEVRAFWAGLRGAFDSVDFRVEHLVECRRPERSPAVALRWRVRARHAGPGRYGEPSGRPVELLGISHAEFAGQRLVREWLLIDDVAIWMQILAPQA
ncbi:MAG: ester cyclase [Rhodoferax sp.]|nr:ester cyclase [Rhodoferax sp.]